MFTRKLSFTKPNYPKAKTLAITEFPYWEYDSNGRLTYYESVDGQFDSYEFDSNGCMTYYENSDGRWFRAEFDSNGECTYCEDSDGLCFKTIY